MAGPYRSGGSNRRQVILASHLVWHGYGHWLPNDLRGSGSTEIRKEELGDIGDIHFGRKRQQPSREELREFYRNANPQLEFEPFWFDAKMRQTMVKHSDCAVEAKGYTVAVRRLLQPRSWRGADTPGSVRGDLERVGGGIARSGACSRGNCSGAPGLVASTLQGVSVYAGTGG